MTAFRKGMPLNPSSALFTYPPTLFRGFAGRRKKQRKVSQFVIEYLFGEAEEYLRVTARQVGLVGGVEVRLKKGLSGRRTVK